VCWFEASTITMPALTSLVGGAQERVRVTAPEHGAERNLGALGELQNLRPQSSFLLVESVLQDLAGARDRQGPGHTTRRPTPPS
jgi:hypothetical protein